MTIRELIAELEKQAQEHGDDTEVTLNTETGFEDINKIRFYEKGEFWGKCWTNMVVLEE